MQAAAATAATVTNDLFDPFTAVPKKVAPTPDVRRGRYAFGAGPMRAAGNDCRRPSGLV
jgi:hypothetical protein